MALLEREIEGVLLERGPALEAAGVEHGFTTRLGGVSRGIFAGLNLGVNRGDERGRVEENYRRVCRALGADEKRLVLSAQVHGDVVRTVTAADWGAGLWKPGLGDCDGLITDVPGTTLVVFGADCVTILLYDPVRKAAGAVHAGWRGTALGIVERALEQMREEYGCRAEEIRAAIGPCIGGCCFETDQDVPDAMREALGEAAAPFITRGEAGKYHVDLKGINSLRLRRYGVLTTNVDIAEDCTMCLPEKYWSHRYTGGKRGSQAALISLAG